MFFTDVLFFLKEKNEVNVDFLLILNVSNVNNNCNVCSFVMAKNVNFFLT